MKPHFQRIAALILVPCLASDCTFAALSRPDRGRESRTHPTPPPSEPDGRVSRIRLSSRWFYLVKD